MKEHHWHIYLTWPDQSAVAEHSFSVEQHLQLQNTKTVTFHTMLHGPEHQGGDTWCCDQRMTWCGTRHGSLSF